MTSPPVKTRNQEETKNSKLKSCIIYLHFPFYIGVGISERLNLFEFEKILRNKIGNTPVTLSMNNEFQISKPRYLEELLNREFVVSLHTLNLKWDRLSDDIVPRHEDFIIRMLDSVITIFNTGIAIGHFKFKIYFRKEFGSCSVYNAYKHIQNQFEPLERKREQTNSEPEISKNVWDLIRILSLGRAQIADSKSEPSIEMPTAYYTYPLFFIPINKMEEMKEFLCLLYLRPSKELVSHDELIKAYNSNTSVMYDEFFAAKWDAAVCGLMEENNSDTLAEILELSSYIWNSEYEMEAYLANQLQSLKVAELSTPKARQELSHIRDLKIRVREVQGIYAQISVSLWTGILHIFDKILFESWNLTKLEKSLNDKMDNLSFNYQYIVDQEEQTHNYKLNKILLNLQRLSIPLAIMIGLLPIIADKEIYQNGVSWERFPILPIFVGVLITVIILVASYVVINNLSNKTMRKNGSF